MHATSKQVVNFNGDWNRLLNGPQKITDIPPIGFAGKNGNAVLTPGYLAAIEKAQKA